MKEQAKEQTPIHLINITYWQALRLAISNGDQDSLRKMGIKDEHVAFINQLSDEDRQKLVNNSHPLVQFKMDEQALALHLTRVTQTNSHDELIRCAIINGASRDMLKTLTGMSIHEFNELSKRYSHQRLYPAEVLKRPHKLTLKEETRLNHCYQEIIKEQSYKTYRPRYQLLAQYVYLSEQTEIAINRVYHYYDLLTTSTEEAL